MFRRATAREIDAFTQCTIIIKERWDVGPYYYQCVFAFDPKGFFVSEIDQELVNHVCAIRYPNSRSQLGGSVVTEKIRGRGYYAIDTKKALNYCNASYTVHVGCDAFQSISHLAEGLGFRTAWDTYIASFNLQNIADKLSVTTVSNNFLVKSLHEMNFDKLWSTIVLCLGQTGEYSWKSGSVLLEVSDMPLLMEMIKLLDMLYLSQSLEELGQR